MKRILNMLMVGGAMVAAADEVRVAKAVEFRPLGETMIYGDAVQTLPGRPFAKDPTVIRHGGRYLMYYSVRGYGQENCPKGRRPRQWSSGIAESRDLLHWTRVGEIRFPKGRGPDGIVAPCVKKFDGRIHLFGQGMWTTGEPNGKRRCAIWHATSEDGLHFTCAERKPVFQPKNGWSVPRAIDAEVYRVKDKLMLIYATREKPTEKVQQLGICDAPYGSSYAADVWRELSTQGPLLKPELPWEMHCLEAATVVERKGVYYLFYAGAYNHERQQIGLAYSMDGCHYRRFRDVPVLPHGQPGSWNAWESGHPGVFQDDDGRIYLFYQGKATLKGDYSLSCLEVVFTDWTDAGLPRPKLEETPGLFKVVFDRKKKAKSNEPVNEPVKMAVIQAVCKEPGIGRPALMHVVGKSRATMTRILSELVARFFVEHRGSDKTGGYFPVAHNKEVGTEKKGKETK